MATKEQRVAERARQFSNIQFPSFKDFETTGSMPDFQLIEKVNQIYPLSQEPRAAVVDFGTFAGYRYQVAVKYHDEFLRMAQESNPVNTGMVLSRIMDLTRMRIDDRTLKGLKYAARDGELDFGGDELRAQRFYIMDKLADVLEALAGNKSLREEQREAVKTLVGAYMQFNYREPNTHISEEDLKRQIQKLTAIVTG